MPVESIVVLSLIVAAFAAFIGVVFCLSWGSGSALSLDDTKSMPKRDDTPAPSHEHKIAAD